MKLLLFIVHASDLNIEFISAKVKSVFLLVNMHHWSFSITSMIFHNIFRVWLIWIISIIGDLSWFEFKDLKCGPGSLKSWGYLVCRTLNVALTNRHINLHHGKCFIQCSTDTGHLSLCCCGWQSGCQWSHKQPHVKGLQSRDKVQHLVCQWCWCCDSSTQCM